MGAIASILKPQILPEDMDDEHEGLLEGEDGGQPSKRGHEEQKDEKQKGAKGPKKSRGWGLGRQKEEYVDPPMPDIGMKVDYEKLLHRKLNVKKATKMLFVVVNTDTKESGDRAAEIPTAENLERVKVTDPIMDLINTRKSTTDDRKNTQENLLLSQKYLSLRKSALNMMNHNYDSTIVRKLDTVQVAEARTKLILHPHSHLPDVVEVESEEDRRKREAEEEKEKKRRKKEKAEAATPPKEKPPVQ